jgi:hypothetical protein
VSTDSTHSKALGILREFAKSRRAILSPKALLEYQTDFGRDADVTHVWDAVCAATEANIHKLEPDEQNDLNTVIVLRVPLLGRAGYIKATMNIERDHNVYVQSCKLRRR